MLACQFRHVDLALAKLANKSDQAPNTDVRQTMLPSFARPLPMVTQAASGSCR